MHQSLTGPQQAYQSLLQQSRIKPSPEQERMIGVLQTLHMQLNERAKKKQTLWGKLIRPKSVHGVYLWGEVGVGKTFLLDLLYETLDLPKLRQHYHVFMQDIQKRLHEIQGQTNPLEKIASEYARRYDVFFLDEFIVNDISNAMVLSGLLKALFKAGICLITTSNIVPDDLYQYGFQREKFLPAIAQIKSNTTVFHLQEIVDYRRDNTDKTDHFYVSADPTRDSSLARDFNCFADAVEFDPWEVCSREIPIKGAAGDRVWFEFHVLCEPPRSQRDYIEIANKIKHLYLSNIPILRPSDTKEASLFIKLVDVLYDQKIKLTASACCEIDDIYPAGSLTFAFERTRSRLTEMSSDAWHGSIDKQDAPLK